MWWCFLKAFPGHEWNRAIHQGRRLPCRWKHRVTCLYGTWRLKKNPLFLLVFVMILCSGKPSACPPLVCGQGRLPQLCSALGAGTLPEFPSAPWARGQTPASPTAHRLLSEWFVCPSNPCCKWESLLLTELPLCVHAVSGCRWLQHRYWDTPPSFAFLVFTPPKVGLGTQGGLRSRGKFLSLIHLGPGLSSLYN